MFWIKGLILFFAVAIVVSLIWFLISIRAPHGYEDEKGFHYGDPKDLQ